MSTSMRSVLAVVALGGLLAGLASPVGAADDKRRATPRSDSPRTAARSSGGSRGQAPSTASRSVAPARTAPRGTAAGRATYGHRGAGSGYGWYPGWSSYYGYPWWSMDLYWGWPAWGPWVYAPPRYYSEPPALVYHDRGPAIVEIDVSPRRAIVLLDGEEVGRAKDWDGRWDRLPVEPGDRVLTFEAPGYKTLRVAIDAAPSGSYRLAYVLAQGEGIDSRSTSVDAKAAPAPPPAPATAPAGQREGLARGFLRVRVTPPDAAVYLDGAYFARAEELARLRGAIPLAPGRHTVEVVRPGFESRKVEVDVSQDRPAEVALDLEKVR